MSKLAVIHGSATGGREVDDRWRNHVAALSNGGRSGADENGAIWKSVVTQWPPPTAALPIIGRAIS